ncbi:hypothetical protein QF035_008897 [Streptomyces umbrinus]|uniref:Uncharacterized protein n=1 Tax=Streptomyces umbrinus TaxID=67370 RepID=A0ABU0T680_9ACTN|nr:hypothetical protein [Streptomyces umbrinus]MDQ1031315.1 hypothetical protein [Streptomyces umbrinus]
MPEPRPAPARSAADLAARLTHQAARLGSALDTREQRTDAGGPEHDHGLHNLARRLLAGVGQHITPEQAPTADGVAQLVLDAEPLRETLALREDDTTHRRETDWELHSLAYMVLTTIDLLSVGYPDLDARVDEAIRERKRARPFSESVAATLAAWPAEQRARLAGELTRYGQELPPDVAAALRTGTDGGPR